MALGTSSTVLGNKSFSRPMKIPVSSAVSLPRLKSLRALSSTYSTAKQLMQLLHCLETNRASWVKHPGKNTLITPGHHQVLTIRPLLWTRHIAQASPIVHPCILLVAFHRQTAIFQARPSLNHKPAGKYGFNCCDATTEHDCSHFTKALCLCARISYSRKKTHLVF